MANNKDIKLGGIKFKELKVKEGKNPDLDIIFSLTEKDKIELPIETITIDIEEEKESIKRQFGYLWTKDIEKTILKKYNEIKISINKQK